MRTLSADATGCRPFVEVRAEEHPVTLPLVELTAFLALDRPDRVEATFSLDGPHDADGAASRAGEHRRRRTLTVHLGGERLASTALERVSVQWSAAGRLLVLVGYSEYHGLRRGLGPRDYYETTDSEIAADAASLLGLVGRIDETPVVHRRVHVTGDALSDLRGRARASGVHLAVTDGRLHFVAELPPAPSETRLGRGDGLLSLEMTERLAGGRGCEGRGGSLEVRGDPRLCPLARISLWDIDPAVDGRYRIVRAIHRLDGDGYRTRLDLLERGVDFGAWELGAFRGAAEGGCYAQRA